MPISLLSGLDRRPLSRSGHRKRPQNPGDARFFPESVPGADISPPARPHRPRNRVRKGRSGRSGPPRGAIRRRSGPISARARPDQCPIDLQNGTLCRADPGIEGGQWPSSDPRIRCAASRASIDALSTALIVSQDERACQARESPPHRPSSPVHRPPSVVPPPTAGPCPG